MHPVVLADYVLEGVFALYLLLQFLYERDVPENLYAADDIARFVLEKRGVYAQGELPVASLERDLVVVEVLPRLYGPVYEAVEGAAAVPYYLAALAAPEEVLCADLAEDLLCRPVSEEYAVVRPYYDDPVGDAVQYGVAVELEVFMDRLGVG